MATSQRNELIAAYPQSTGWAARVQSMTDAQVFAIYLRLKKEGKIKT